ncbi:MAG: GntR family transcriptional regulator [Clostridium sp.]
MNIVITNKSNVPIYEQIALCIKEEIEGGSIKKDEILPSIRSLARELRISVVTTKKAYEELESEGYVYTVRGKGIFVADVNLDFVKDEKIRKLEDELLEIIERCRSIGLEYSEFSSMVKILWGNN